LNDGPPDVILVGNPRSSSAATPPRGWGTQPRMAASSPSGILKCFS